MKSFKRTNCSSKILENKGNEWLTAFELEASLFEQANNWEEFWRIYKEQPLLTLLATGLSRADSQRALSILREYPVYQGGDFIGSSDLFLNYHVEKRHFYIEAKYERARWETGFVMWSDENFQKFLKETSYQLDSYIEAEHDKNFESYSVVLLFHIVDFKKEEDFEAYRALALKTPLSLESFYAFIPARNPNNSPYNTFGVLEVAGFFRMVH
ncbi:hypothetical protein [Flaviaesturariibacter amylovorans]|uniref:DUF4263 domain-containing protein n=1 Tax=Flaviaesturariibacter amylovorans TaxID=1084520 RepID=A0ABP8G3S9_9BACT